MTAFAVRDRLTRPPAALRDSVWAALSRIREPEFDDSIVASGFVVEVGIAGPDVAVVLRLPEFSHWPGSPQLIAAEAYDAVSALSGVGRVTIEVSDHPAAAEINAGVAGDSSSRPEPGTDTPDNHRSMFRRNAYRASLDRACRLLCERGWDADELPAAQLFDLPAGPERSSLLQRRDTLGLTTDPQDYLLCTPTGDRLTKVRSPEQ